MRRFDAIVVGAGPAGSSTAYRLAEAGASVLVLDRASFPRDKPCGGGVTPRALEHSPVPIDAVVEHVAREVELRLRFGRRAIRGRGGLLAYMTQRSRLDALLAERAAGAGADFRDGVKVRAVEADARGVTVDAGGERVRGETVVGADGANGITARSLGLGGNRSADVALEGNLPREAIDTARYDGRILLELGTIRGGYGWVFPKGDHLNVGVGGDEGEGPRLRDHLARLCAAHGFGIEELEVLRGHRLPHRAADSTLARGRALLVGDAAGLVDPLTGDGMFEAFLSGRFAADAVTSLLAGETASLDEYGGRLSRRLAAHLWAGWTFRAALDRFPWTAYALAKSRLGWPVIESLLTGELADVSGAVGLARAPIRALTLLGRAAGNPGHAYRPA